MKQLFRVLITPLRWLWKPLDWAMSKRDGLYWHIGAMVLILPSAYWDVFTDRSSYTPIGVFYATLLWTWWTWTNCFVLPRYRRQDKVVFDGMREVMTDDLKASKHDNNVALAQVHVTMQLMHASFHTSKRDVTPTYRTCPQCAVLELDIQNRVAVMTEEEFYKLREEAEQTGKKVNMPKPPPKTWTEDGL